MKLTLLTLAIGVVAVLIWFFYKKLEFINPNFKETVSTNTTAIGHFHTLSKIHDEADYQIAVFYPETANMEFNQKIEQMIDKQIEDFLDVASQNEFLFTVHGKSELNINYELFAETEVATIVFDIYNFHGEPAEVFQITYYYDTKLKKEISPMEWLARSNTSENVPKVLPSSTTIPTAQARKTREVALLQDKKLVAITFDDGPGKNTTPELLDGLKERGVKVTFFVLGTQVKQNPDIVKRAHDEGHTIASHTYSHKNLVNLTGEDLQFELEETSNLVFDLIGVRPQFLRPPYGSFNETVQAATDLSLVLWDVDPEDWKYRDTNTVYNHIIDHTGENDIVLVHDLYETSVQGALQAIDDLLMAGFELVSFEELVELGRVDPNKKQVYYSIVGKALYD